MYKNHKDNDEQNFWISYADLMAGLLFVFILVVGAIVIKYVFVQKDLKQKEQVLEKTSQELSSKNKKVLLFKEKLKTAAQKIKEEEERKKLLNNKLQNKESYIKSLFATIDQKDKNISELNNTLALKEQKLSSLNETLHLKEEDITKLKDLLMGYELKSADMEKNISTLQTKLAANENILILKDEEIETLGKKLLEDAKEHQMLVDELNITKVKIKNLTGIRIKVVKKLRDELGKSINIDPKSGAIRFSSNILFNQGEYTLKPEAKKELSSTIKRYIQTLLSNDDIREYIDQITIEGHTDTDGSYFYNLALSQKRALEVMKFIYKDDPKNEELYKRYLSVSGRSYSDLILDQNGKEDKEASRRIEVKFRIKNEDAMREIERFLSK